MIQKKLVATLSLATLTLGLVTCQSSSQQTSTTTTPTANTAAAVAEAQTLPIAYVRMDSITSQYVYAQEVRQKLEKEAEASRARLQSKAAALQKAGADFERKARINAFVSQEAAQAEQNKLLKMQQEVQALQDQLSQQLAQQQSILMEDMVKEVQEQIKAFNNGKYMLILTNIGVDNILYADDAMDITDDVIKYLNDNYKSKDTTSSSQNK